VPAWLKEMEGLQVDVLVPARGPLHIALCRGELGRIQYDNVEAFGLLPESAKRYERISRYVSDPRAIESIGLQVELPQCQGIL